MLKNNHIPKTHKYLLNLYFCLFLQFLQYSYNIDIYSDNCNHLGTIARIIANIAITYIKNAYLNSNCRQI